MRYIYVFIAILSAQFFFAQEKTVPLSADMYIGIHEIQLAQRDGWYFKAGNNVGWAKNDLDLSDWKALNPTDLNAGMIDKNGHLEGWFRLKVKLDDSFANQQLGIRFYCWAAVDLYIDGKYIQSFGNTGINGKPFQEFNPGERLPILVDLKAGQEHLIAFHFVDELATYPYRGLNPNRQV
ncbi:hypothetical protein [Flavobacterium sp. 3HN19-14]|uniref:hypothetical protein n=1 Tax=Flavobacterium sp. 3HN19-14 TaxID=3448133 RepID=UPI003EE1E59C